MGYICSKEDLQLEMMMRWEIYGPTFDKLWHLSQSNIDATEFRVDFHQHIESKTTILRLASNIELDNALRCNSSYRIAKPLDRSVNQRAFRRSNDEKKFHHSATIESWHNLLLKTPCKFISRPIYICILPRRLTLTDSYTFVVGCLTKCANESIEITVDLIPATKDKNSPFLESCSLGISVKVVEVYTCLNTAFLPAHSPLVTAALLFLPNASCGRGRRRPSISVMFCETLIPYALSMGSLSC
jgi:hypothetical protein